MPSFSLVIPVYNVAPYLRECLESVLAQTLTDWEAICWGDGGRTLLCKQIVKSDFGLDAIGVGVSHEPVCRNHRQVYGLRCLADGAKHFGFVSKFLYRCFINRVAPLGEFHFTYVYDVVRPVEKEVDLCAYGIDFICVMSPCVYFRVDTCYSECFSHLLGMLQAETLKCQAAPGRLARRSRCAG